MQLFYSPYISEISSQFTFDKVESRHIVKVLRKTEGNDLFITNGKNSVFKAQILIANDKKCIAKIISEEKKQKPWDYYLHVAIAPTKNNDRLEWFLEKAVEIGIDEITPIICKHSERKVIKKERFEKVIVSAMKQSLKYQLPILNDAISFTNFMNQDHEGDLFIAHCVESDKKTLKEHLKPQQRVTVLIGPEGDFSKSEIEKALSKHFTPVTFGENRLRTETAGIVAAQSVSFFNQ